MVRLSREYAPGGKPVFICKDRDTFSIPVSLSKNYRYHIGFGKEVTFLEMLMLLSRIK